MLRLFNQMMKFPGAAFVYAMEILTKAMQEVQRGAERTIDTFTRELAEADNAAGRSSLELSAETDNLLTNKEDNTVTDQDLSGDDLKYVSYSILFTKRDLEATLKEQKEELVNYSTNGGSFGGLKIAHFMREVMNGEVSRPALWRENNYPPGSVGDQFSIPTEDEKYITFIYHVERRILRQEANYDRDLVKVAREISQKIG